MLLAHAQRQPVRGSVDPVLVSVLQRKSIERCASAKAQRSLGAELRAPDAGAEGEVVALHRHVRHFNAGGGQRYAIRKQGYPGASVQVEGPARPTVRSDTRGNAQRQLDRGIREPDSGSDVLDGETNRVPRHVARDPEI